MITLKLSQKEAQAILSGAATFFQELKEVNKHGHMGVFWKILYSDFEKGLKKANKQYDNQIKDIKEVFDSERI